MSLYGTMRTGVSGMNAQANRLSTVADNIANANTTGYKKASTQFSSLILPTTGGAYNSGGVTTDVRYSISQQGTFTYTTSATDLAINGQGFFIVTGADGVEYLTRAGAFTVMDDGAMLNSAGFKLMGYEYSSTDDPTIVVNGFDGLKEINLSSGSLTATGSTAGALDANLPSNEPVGYTKTTSLVAYDSQGNTRLLDYVYTKTANNTWTVDVKYNGVSVMNQPMQASTRSNATGNLDPATVVGTIVTNTATAYDSTGAARTLTYNYTKTATGWTAEVLDGATSLGTSNLTFDAAGVLTSGGALTTTASGTLGALNIDFSAMTQVAGASSNSAMVDGNAANASGPVTLTFDTAGKLLNPSSLRTQGMTINGATLAPLDISIAGTTQLGSPFDVSNGKINGNAVSKVVGYEISADGVVSLKYGNGVLEPKYRIAMANVQSPDNLKPLAGNVYSQSNDSGVIVMGYAGNSSYGSILSGALEDSNVDIAEELTSMIEAQRNYTANSKVFQTGSELMDVLVNLKR
ncbi:flagellar hook protein FlgE [Rhizobium sp. ARZ01]|uniref:flagellar hook protein FlgE n=1 Tax=Rhizobium sp. ARZ01 TaxID=2769313 RepID=UPI001FEE795D|nr:flagellar hook protein FlgE [Rhizobium sp. ARZ01]